jgi:hypothetical protein
MSVNVFTDFILRLLRIDGEFILRHQLQSEDNYKKADKHFFHTDGLQIK